MMRFGVLVVVAVCLFGGVQCGEKYWWMNQVSDVQFIDADKTDTGQKVFLPRNTQDARSTGHFSGDEEEEEEEQDSKFFWREIQIFK